ncbi:hypothetical protein [Dyadobacter fanqingshengii]|uniref:hypothetical protein n=1 Tax=Dyadobacter fanqingshengii TaxID=2906443 RepID=UPI00286E79C0|nr:hypothetical protein [Dyadobacter fanqingshengii]
MDEVAFDWGLKTKVKISDKEVELYSGRVYRSTIICRTMDNPSNIVGFKIGKALVDEIDVHEDREGAAGMAKDHCSYALQRAWLKEPNRRYHDT